MREEAGTESSPGGHSLRASWAISFVFTAPPEVAQQMHRGSPWPRQGSGFGTQVAAESRGHLSASR